MNNLLLNYNKITKIVIFHLNRFQFHGHLNLKCLGSDGHKKNIPLNIEIYHCKINTFITPLKSLIPISMYNAYNIGISYLYYVLCSLSHNFNCTMSMTIISHIIIFNIQYTPSTNRI